MPAPPFDAVLFDLDGTLLATERFWLPAARRAARRTLAELGLARDLPSSSEWLSLVGGRLSDGLARLFPELPPPALARLAELCDEEERALVAAGGAALLPGVAEALDALRGAGARVGLASNCGRGYLASVTAALDLGRWVEEARCLDAGGRGDKADMVEDLLATFGTRSAVLVGDRASDVRAARANGIPSVHVRTGYGEPDEGAEADAAVEDLGELGALLSRRTEALARAVGALGLAGGARRAVGVTGGRAAGKTLFARDLARAVREAGRPAAAVTVGEAARGGEAPWEGLEAELQRALEGRGPDALTVVEGPWLLHPTLRRRLDAVVHLEAPPELRLERVRGRDGRLAGPGPVARAAEELAAEDRFRARFPPETADLVADGRPLAPPWPVDGEATHPVG